MWLAEQQDEHITSSLEKKGVKKMTIIEMRKLLGLSQVAFAKKYGIPARTIENWESGASQPTSYLLTLLERAVQEDAKTQE